MSGNGAGQAAILGILFVMEEQGQSPLSIKILKGCGFNAADITSLWVGGFVGLKAPEGHINEKDSDGSTERDYPDDSIVTLTDKGRTYILRSRGLSKAS